MEFEYIMTTQPRVRRSTLYFHASFVRIKLKSNFSPCHHLLLLNVRQLLLLSNGSHQGLNKLAVSARSRCCEDNTHHRLLRGA